MADWTKQRYFDDVKEGDEVPPVTFNLTVQRMIMQAGANRDFAQIHHNSRVAQKQGAPEMYINNVFIQSIWERTAREFAGLQGWIRKVGPFRMRIFNTVGESVVSKGTVKRKWQENGDNLVELELWCENSKGVSVGPGPVLITLPSRGR